MGASLSLYYNAHTEPTARQIRIYIFPHIGDV